MTGHVVRPTMRQLHSPDALELDAFRPTVPECFGILVEAMIGPDDAEGEESFQFILCTPQWIARELDTRDFRWGRPTLVVQGYAYATLERAVVSLCRRTEGKDWPEVAEKLNRWMGWEFEDYRESPNQ